MGENSSQNMASGDLVMSATSGLMSAIGAYTNARHRKWAFERKAELASKRGADKERISGIRTGRLYGAQRAAFAANGLDMAGSPTVLNVLADTADEGVREAGQIRTNAAREAAGYRAQARSESPSGAAFSSLIGSAGTVASKWYSYNQSGLYPFGIGEDDPFNRVNEAKAGLHI